MFRVSGRSMSPTLEPGDLVFVRPFFGRLPPPEALVVVRSPRTGGRPWIKRVDSCGEHTFSLRSDNPLEGADSRQYGSFALEELVGVVAFMRPAVRGR